MDVLVTAGSLYAQEAQSPMEFVILNQKRCWVFCLFFWILSPCAQAETNLSFTTNLEQQAQSSSLSLDTSKKFESVEVVADLSGEYAAPYASPKNVSDGENFSLTAVSSARWKPTVGLSAVTSLRDKTTTWGVKSGVSIPLAQSSYQLTWSPNLSAKRTGLRLEGSSNKSGKKLNTALLQYGTSQSLALVRENVFSLNVFYQRYFYNANIAELTRKLSTATRFIPKNKKLQTIFETVSVFSKSLLGASVFSKMGERFEMKTDYFRTTYQRDDTYSDMLIPRITTTLTDQLDAYIQADLLLTEPQSQTFTLSFPYAWTDAWSSEVGFSQLRNEQEKSWSLLLALSYSLHDSDDKIRAENQSQ
ncbi:MAG: hypothetical protein RI932_87 [Pseudomonadota bacterium]